MPDKDPEKSMYDNALQASAKMEDKYLSRQPGGKYRVPPKMSPEDARKAQEHLDQLVTSSQPNKPAGGTEK